MSEPRSSDAHALDREALRLASMASTRRTISLKDACHQTGKTRKTVISWCHKHGIGKQHTANAEWRIDPVALSYVLEGHLEPLKAYLAARDARLIEEAQALGTAR